MLLLFFTLATSTVFCLLAFSANPFMTHYCLKRRKIYERFVLYFYFVSFVLNVIVFIYNGLKQSLILQTEPNRLLQISFFFHRDVFYLYLKKVSCFACGETCTIVVTFVSISYFASQICINPNRDTLLVPKKKPDKFFTYKFNHSILS